MFNYNKITFVNSVNNTIELTFTDPLATGIFNGRFINSNNKFISVDGLDSTITDKQAGGCKLTITTTKNKDYSSVVGFRMLYSTSSGVKNITIPVSVVTNGWNNTDLVISKEGGEYSVTYGVLNDVTWEGNEYINCSVVKRILGTRSQEIIFEVDSTTENRNIEIIIEYNNTSTQYTALQRSESKPSITVQPSSWNANTSSYKEQEFKIVTDGTITNMGIYNLPSWIQQESPSTGFDFKLLANINPSIKDTSATALIRVDLEDWGSTELNLPITQAGHYIEIPNPIGVASYEQQTIRIPFTKHWIESGQITVGEHPDWIDIGFGNQIIIDLTENDSSSRQATVNLTVSIGNTLLQELYITVIQLEEGYGDIPIWKDTIYTEDTNSWIEYHIDDINSNVLYAGKAYPYPDKNYIEILLNDITSNFLKSMNWPTSNGFNQVGDYSKVFILKTSTDVTEPYIFNNNWSYKEEYLYTNSPCNIVDPRQLFIVSGDKDYKIVYGDNTIQFTNLSTYRLDLSNVVIPCGSKISVYKDNELIKEYTVANGKDYVLYYTNAVGGWDFITVKGNTTRTDNITSSLYERRPVRPSKEFGNTKYLNTITPSWSLNTGYIKGNISELVSSLNVYLYDLNTKDLIPVNITTTSAEYLNYTNNGKHFTNYTVEVEASQKNFRK